MSDRMTRVGPREGAGPGLEEFGLVGRSDAIERYRSYYERQLRQAARALAIPDEGLVVETYLGPYAQRDLREVTDD